MSMSGVSGWCLGVSGWCLGVTWWCLEVSGWCVRVSGHVSIPSPMAKCYIRSLCSNVAFSSNANGVLKMPMSGGVCMVYMGV